MGVMVSPVAGGDVALALRLLLVVVDNVDKLQHTSVRTLFAKMFLYTT